MHCGKCKINEKILRVRKFMERVKQLKEEIEKKTGLKVMTGEEFDRICSFPYFSYDRWIGWDEMKGKVLVDMYVTEGSAVLVDIEDEDYNLCMRMGVAKCNDKPVPVVVLEWWVEGMTLKDLDDLTLVIFLTPT
jgi:hypothetical protein